MGRPTPRALSFCASVVFPEPQTPSIRIRLEGDLARNSGIQPATSSVFDFVMILAIRQPHANALAVPRGLLFLWKRKVSHHWPLNNRSYLNSRSLSNWAFLFNS